jgi:hypothetical protein
MLLSEEAEEAALDEDSEVVSGESAEACACSDGMSSSSGGRPR